ncbi:MAG: extracellular solute-binding protein [Candidatus Izemoplasmatales bacterium]
MKRLLIALVVLLSGFASLACRQSTTAEPVLNLVLSGLQQPSEKVFFRTFVRLFEAETGITVELTYALPADLADAIAAEAASDVVTDVVMVDTANMKAYLDRGLMEDVSAYLATLRDRTFTTMFDPYTSRDGARYFMPVSFDVYLTIVNRAALPFMPATVEVVRNQEDEVVAIERITWEDYAAWAIAIRDGSGSPHAGVPMSASGSQLLYPLGGMAVAFGAGFPSIDDPHAAEAWNLLASMAAGGAILPENILSTVNQPTALLDTGSLWMSFGHMGPVGAAYDADPFAYVLGPAPVASSTGIAGSIAGAWTFGIVGGAPHPDAARAWLRFISDPETNYLYCSQLGGVISPIAEVVGHLGDSNTDRIMAAGIAMVQSDAEIVVLDVSAFVSWTDVKVVYTDLYRRILTGEPLATDELAVFEDRLDALRVPAD